MKASLDFLRQRFKYRAYVSTLASEGWLDKSTPTSPVAATESGGGLHEKKKRKKELRVSVTWKYSQGES